MSEQVMKKKKFQMPDAQVLMVILILIAVICTWFVPAGQFERIEDPATGNVLAVPGSYKEIESQPVGFVDFLVVIPRALEEVAGIFFFVLLIGGGIGLVSSTGAFDAMVATFLRKFGDKGRFIIFFLVYFFGLCAASAGFCSEFLVFIPIMIVLFKALGYDAMVALGVTLCVSATGYGAAPIGAFNVGVAQGIAGLPLFSGMGFRWILWIVLFTALAFYVYHYAEKVRKDPSKSIVKDIDYSDMEMSHEALNAKLSKRQIGVLLVFLSAISFLIFAAVKGGILGPWYTYSAIFFVMGITAGIVAGYSADKIVEEYVNGCKLLLYAGIVLGTAKAIAIVLEDGMIIDTLVNWLVIPLQAFGGSSQSVAGIIMMFIQILLNLIMPTNSGQALATMPILLPLGDLVGLNKQITVLAFQLGDGLTMMLFPTNGVLMAGLALARVPFDKWMKFAMPLAVIQIGIACIALVVASFINYGPF